MALVDLNSLYISLSDSVRLLPYAKNECSLSMDGQAFILRIFSEKGYSDVSFERSTTTFIDNEGRIQHCANQYFRFVPYAFEYYKALFEYKKNVSNIDRILKKNLPSVKGKKKPSVLVKCKNTLVNDIPENVLEVIESTLASDGYSDSEISYFKRFICDYSWWGGQKEIDRTDYYHSPLLSMLNVVHLENGFYMKLVQFFDLNLSQEGLQSLLGVQVDKISHSPNSTYVFNKVIGKNLIIYGAPGTGKSHKISQLSSGHTVMTTTFHSEYSYSDFIGSYRPFPLYQMPSISRDDENRYFDVSGNEFTRGRPFIDYRFVPGDFLRILTEALRGEHTQNNKHYVLVIEELNRGNAAAIFGDFFQLLDRDLTGKSKYTIMNGDVVNYLKETLRDSFTGDKVYIPGNLSIYATMNSADQGVFPLDTAFKRRWNYEYLRINYAVIRHGETQIPYGGGLVTFKNFMETINANLSARLQVHEDKLLGSYFISPEELEQVEDETDEDYALRLKELISNKILMYLWDDVARYQRAVIFKQTVTFGDIIHQYKSGEQIFTFDFLIEDNNIDMNEELDEDETT